MLKQDQIKEHLPHLEEADLKVIETLSKNDEDQVIHDKTRDWWKGIDKDVFEATGIEKGGTEKSFDYLKSALKNAKTALETAKESTTKITDKENEIKELKKQIADGGGEAIKKQLSDKEAEITSLKELHQTQLKEKEDAIAQKESDLAKERFETTFAKALSGLEFKGDDVTSSVKDTVISAAKAQLLSEATMEVVDGVEQWRGKDGQIIRNPKNQNNPMTTQELLSQKLEPIIDTGRKAEGGGTGKPNQPPKPFSGKITAKTQTEFTEQATDILIAQGVARGTTDFIDKMTELRKEHKAAELPML